MQPTTSTPSTPKTPKQPQRPPEPQAAPRQVPSRQETELSRIAELGYN